MKVLITSGGCKVPIDDVRHIGNFSSGRHGSELADEFLEKGHEVIFFMEKGSARPYPFDEDNLEVIQYKYYEDYLKVKDVIKEHKPDIIISAAAISDYIVDKTEGKISSTSDELVIRLKKGEKVIGSFRELAPNAFIVGYKLLVSPSYRQKYEAIDKIIRSGCDAVVYNDLTELRAGNSSRLLYHALGENNTASIPQLVDYIVDLRRLFS